MPPLSIARCLCPLATLLAYLAHAAESPGRPAAAFTATAPLAMPAAPIASRAQLDAYLHATSPDAAPLGWMTRDGRQRFLASLRFGQRGLGGFGTDDLRYDLTLEQAYAVLQLFDAQHYALGLSARTKLRPSTWESSGRHIGPAYARLIDKSETAAKPERRRLADETYAAQFAPWQQAARLRTLGDRDVEFLFRAANHVLGLSSQSRHIEDMRLDFAELARRGLIDRPHASDLYDTLLSAHRNDEARVLLAAYPVLERKPPPALREASGLHDGQPSLWVAATNRRELTREPFALDAPAQIVVLAGTGCHFSQDTVRDIDADPTLHNVFRQHARWIAPSAEIAHFDAVQAWTRDHPDQPLAIAYDDAAWPVQGDLHTPTFYVLRQGRLLRRIVGWPHEDGREALRQALREAGLIH